MESGVGATNLTGISPSLKFRHLHPANLSPNSERLQNQDDGHDDEHYVDNQFYRGIAGQLRIDQPRDCAQDDEDDQKADETHGGRYDGGLWLGMG